MFFSSGRLLTRPRVRRRDPLTGRAVIAGVAWYGDAAWFAAAAAAATLSPRSTRTITTA